MNHTQKTHIAKTITWRIVATTTTLTLTWIISGQFELGVTVAGFEFFLKMLLYYLHERAWYRYSYGLFRERKGS
ncbi:MAG: DUF2061 domain-containing protein [Bacteroidota bacterium]